MQLFPWMKSGHGISSRKPGTSTPGNQEPGLICFPQQPLEGNPVFGKSFLNEGIQCFIRVVILPTLEASESPQGHLKLPRVGGRWGCKVLWGKGDGQQKSKRFNNTLGKMRLSHVKSIHFISHYIFKVTGGIRSPLFVPF